MNRTFSSLNGKSLVYRPCLEREGVQSWVAVITIWGTLDSLPRLGESSIPLYLYTSIPLYLYTSIPLYLYTIRIIKDSRHATNSNFLIPMYEIGSQSIGIRRKRVCGKDSNSLFQPYFDPSYTISEAEFKEYKPRLRFETRLKYGWFHLNLYSMF